MGCGMELAYFFEVLQWLTELPSQGSQYSLPLCKLSSISDLKATKIVACVDFWWEFELHKVSIVGSSWERITGQKLSM